MPPSRSSLAPRAHRAGDVVAGYTLVAAIGSGGMGAVWQARGPAGTEVALKLLHPSLASSDVLVQRFLREVALGRRIVHPGVVRTLDGGLIEVDGEPPQPWLAMELVHGETLRQVLERDGPMPEAEVRWIGAAIAEALAAIHAEGIVHRDVKPDNVLRDAEGNVQLMDLGVARARDDALRLTRSGQFAGSVIYAAPEQFHGASDRVDGRVDVYALGATVYELATGQLPWPGIDLLAVYGQKMRGVIPAPSGLRPKLGHAFDALIRQLLHPDPARRPATAHEAASLLRGELTVTGPIDDDGLTFAVTLGDDGPPLPRPADAFVGRVVELQQIDDGWDSGRVLTVTGAAGSGKTRLALEYGARFRPRFPGGVRLADLVSARDSDGVILAVAAAFDLALQPGDGLVQVGAVLRGRGGVLLVLDNAEPVLAVVASLVPALAIEAPEAAFLVTSRAPLRVSGERVLTLDALGLPESDAVDDVAESDAVRLFVSRARDVHPAFALDARNAGAVAELVRALDGLPLAIELAAARVKLLSPRQIVERLSRRWALLQGPGAGRPERHAALRAAIQASWDLLEPWGRAALAQLSVFEGGFTAETAESVLDLGAFPDGPWTLDGVESLVDASLLRRLGGDPVRFGMYAAIQEFAAEQLDAATRDAAEARHGAAFAELALDAGARWHDGSDPGALATLAAEAANLGAVARRRTGVEAARVAWALGLLAERRGPVRAGVDTLSEVARRDDAPLQERIGLLAVLARLQGLASQLDDGIRTWAEVATLATDAGDPVHAAYALTGRAMLDFRAGRNAEARDGATAGLDAFTAIGDPRGIVAARRALGVLALHQGQLDEGRVHLLAAMDALDPADLRSASAVHNNLGLLEVRAGRLAEAAAWLEQALAYDRAAGDRLGEGHVLTNLGILAAQGGDVARARVLFEQALAAHREAGNAEGEAKTLNNLAGMAAHDGDLDLAHALLKGSIAIKRTLGQPGGEAYGLVHLGEIEQRRGRVGAARAALDRALALAREAGEDRVADRAEELLSAMDDSPTDTR